MTTIDLEVGDSVVVNSDVSDPDLGINIGGWQGRIVEIDERHNLVFIEWDSLTLSQMSDEVISQCEEDGLDWRRMYLLTNDVERTSPRDSEDDVDDTTELFESRHGWSHLGEEGKRIQAVLAKTDDVGEWAAYEAWETHLRQMLQFPFEAEVSEWQDRGSLRTGDRGKVLGIEGVEDPYGVLVTLQRGRRKFVFPLSDLEVTDHASSNYLPVKDYAVWFANR